MLLYDTVEPKMSSNLKNEEKETPVISLGGKERTRTRRKEATQIHQFNGGGDSFRKKKLHCQRKGIKYFGGEAYTSGG
jgi:hypothetical protein